MFRKVMVLACVVVGLHIVGFLTLGTSTAAGVLGNSLQIFFSGLAAAACFSASRRGGGLSRPFWLLAGCGMGTLGIADIGWVVFEDLVDPVGAEHSVGGLLLGRYG